MSSTSTFSQYPDVLLPEEVCEILGICTKTFYSLLQENKLPYLKIGRINRVPKYLLKQHLGIQASHKHLFREYPDVVDVPTLANMLRICTKTVYSLLQKEQIPSMRILTQYRIPKQRIVQFIASESILSNNVETKEETAA